jgi:hypothetical protein
MNGLYQRALEVQRQEKGPHLVRKSVRGDGVDDIPAEERESVLREIDALLERNRLGLDTGKPKGGKSGLALPLLVNLLIFMAVGAAIFLFTSFSRSEETRLVAESRSVKGAENQLVEALRRESAAQLDQKDQAIISFQQKLADAAAERDRLGTQAEETIRRREQELAAETAATLAAERAKLRDAGVGAADVESRIALLQTQLQAESTTRFEDFQRQAREDAARSAAAVDALIADYQRNLSQAQSDRSRLQQQYEAREAELKSQYAQEALSIQAEKTAALADLSRVREIQQQEGLVEDRIIAGYDAIESKIAAGDYAKALENVAKLRESLDQEPAKSVESIHKRRAVELFMLGALEELIRNRAERGSASAAAMVAAKASLDAAREKATQADQAFARKDFVAARSLYQDSLAALPEARTSHERLQAMALAERESQLAAVHAAELETERSARTAAEEAARQEVRLAAERLAAQKNELEATAAALDRERTARMASEALARTATTRIAELETSIAGYVAQLADADLVAERAARRDQLRGYGFEAITEARSLMAGGSWDEALEKYRKALGWLLEDDAEASAIIDQAALAGYEGGAAADAARRAALPEAIAEMRRELLSSPPPVAPPAAAAPAASTGSALDIAVLLRAKLLLWQILQTDPIKTQYPELEATMRSYFDVLAAEQNRAGREAALSDLLAIVESTGEGGRAKSVAAVPESERALLAELLGVLERLTRDQAFGAERP